jgi:hypothetical protein
MVITAEGKERAITRWRRDLRLGRGLVCEKFF